VLGPFFRGIPHPHLLGVLGTRHLGHCLRERVAAKSRGSKLHSPGTLRTKLGATLREPRLVLPPFGHKHRINPFHFVAVEQEVLWEFLLTDATPPVTPTVNDRIARRTMLLTQVDTDS